jgi:hypothetical protein
MSVWFSIGWVGFGVDAGLFPEIRCGLFAVGWCRGSIGQNLRWYADRVRVAMQALGGRS